MKSQGRALTRVPALPGLCVHLAALVAACAGCGGMVRNDNAEGVRLYQQGNYLGAVNHFQQALARQPGDPDCFYNLGATYHQQAKLFGQPADLATAEQYYHLCLARAPGHEACRRALSVLLVVNRLLWIDFVEIRMSGKELNLDPTLMFLWLSYWGWAWGVLGLLLAYPMLAAVKIVLTHVKGGEGWAVLLSEDAPIA